MRINIIDGGLYFISSCVCIDCVHFGLGSLIAFLACCFQFSKLLGGILVLARWYFLACCFQFGYQLLGFWHFGISCWHVAWVIGGIFWHVAASLFLAFWYQLLACGLGSGWYFLACCFQFGDQLLGFWHFGISCWHVAWVVGGIFWHVASSFQIPKCFSGILVLAADMWLGFFDSLSGTLLLVFILAAGWLLVEFSCNFFSGSNHAVHMFQLSCCSYSSFLFFYV